MPAHKIKTIKVNLLPKDPFTESPLGKFLSWALSAGRYIVVFTELIVILTFLSRFTLDRQLTDLNEEILKKQAILDSYEDLETKIRSIQAKAKFLSKIEDAQQLVPVTKFVLEKIPDDIIFEDFDTRDDKFIISGKSYSQTSLANFIDVLKAETTFADVNLDKINTNEKDTGISFILRAIFAAKPDSISTSGSPNPTPATTNKETNNP